ncbi:MAG: DUF1566 domain-containing protein [Pseudomonadota bacterium]|nr:DUF1566 domain-containing protein [Pseudomonadota bacterium]
MQKKRLILALLAGVAMSGAAQAALHDRGSGLIYDDVLNLTWLADANYAKTSGYDADGLMTWANAVTWADNLVYHDSVRNVDYSDWRLPTVSPINGTAFNYNYSASGTTDYGYNVSAPGTAYAGGKGSEMAHLFFNDLGNKAYYNASGTPQSGYGVTNAGPFQNLQSYVYWSGTEYAPSSGSAWYFYTSQGVQNYDGKGYNYYAWAVRPGDVAAAPVPEAESYALLALGMGLTGWLARRRG